MKAIDELRTHMNFMWDKGLEAMDISTVKSDLDEIERELEEEYVALPKDADGKVFRVGCTVRMVERHPEVLLTVNSMTLCDDGEWRLYAWNDKNKYSCNLSTSSFEVCEPPTVEDVLRDFFDEYDSVSGYAPDENEVLAKFAERLQLRGRDDG